MSKNYQNTIIYKIVCKDVSINDIYVGHTTDFIKRKCGHKSMCNNNKKNLKIYKTIRENGGWENWEMVEIEKYPCNNGGEARARERYWIVGLNCSMNSNMNSNMKSNMNSNMNSNNVDSNMKSKKSPYYCVICNVNCHKKNTYAVHIETKKHKTNEKGENILKKNGVFQCEDCDLVFTKKQNLQTHIQSLKHLKKTKQIEESEKDNQCLHCGKEYSSRSGLWKHIKTMHKNKNENENENEDEDDEATKQYPNNVITSELMMLLQQNKEMHEAVIELVKKIGFGVPHQGVLHDLLSDSLT
jgi:hypothetical protein